MFGGKRFVFNLVLEFVVNFGKHFCVCTFEEPLEGACSHRVGRSMISNVCDETDFDGVRVVSQLQYEPLQTAEHARFTARGLVSPCHSRLLCFVSVFF
jgi:hypothetical protein